MNQFYDPAKLTIGLRVGLELDPYILNYPINEDNSVWVANQGGRSFVLRFYQQQKGNVDDFLANARKYAAIKHASITPNYPPFYSSLWVFSSSAVCGGEKLYSFLGKYPDGAPLNVVLSIFDGIAKALDQTHQKNLFHGHLDLNSIHVVNGAGVMIGFGSCNWQKTINDTDMDMRFAAPECHKNKVSVSADADRYAFMRLLLATLLGESKISATDALVLPHDFELLSETTWKKIKGWSRPAARHRPKSLIDVMRLLRADLYLTSANRKTRPVSKVDFFTTHWRKMRDKPPYIPLGIFTSTLFVTLLLYFWPDEVRQQQILATPTTESSTTEITPYEALPTSLEEPLKVGGNAPKVNKLPPATFNMGDQQGIGDDNERPVRSVLIPQGFYMARNEVTFAQYDQFALSTNRALPPDNGWGRGNRPVINVSWYDAKAYAQWLSDQTGQEYRLPTEVEWEYSIRAGSNTSFWYGNDIKSGYSVCDGCGSTWDALSTAPVASQISNPFGLFDMHGNVAEWIEDCYHDSYDAAPTVNVAWVEDDCRYRVLRGGSWFDIPRVGRSSTRYRADPNLQASNWGFRVVRIIRHNNTETAL